MSSRIIAMLKGWKEQGGAVRFNSRSRRAALALPLLCAAALAAAMPAKQAPAKSAASRVKVELYVMSHCPFGIEAENGLLPAVQALGSRVELSINFIGGAVAAAAGRPYSANNQKFNSMHGPSEVDDDLRQVCMAKLYPKALLAYILARDKNTQDPDWQAAAARSGADAAKVSACAAGDEGAALLTDSFKASQDRNANSSPTIYIDAQPYQGQRSSPAFAFAICGAFKAKGTAGPAACRQALEAPEGQGGNVAGCGAAPPPLKFDVRVVTDKACPACAPTLLDALKRRHPGADIRLVDAQSKEGSALIAAQHAAGLPLYVLDKDVEQESDFASVKSFYMKSAGGYIILPGPDTYAPTVQLSREARPGHLDVFVQALSPLSGPVLSKMASFLAQSKREDLTFSVHFIVEQGVKPDSATAVSPAGREGERSASLKELGEISPGALTSPDGEAGVQESLRQACLFEHSTVGNYFLYLDCLQSDPGNQDRGKACLDANPAVRRCIDGAEGRRLLSTDAQLVRLLGVKAPGALLWENRYGPFAWNDVDWQTLISADAH